MQQKSFRWWITPARLGLPTRDDSIPLKSTRDTSKYRYRNYCCCACLCPSLRSLSYGKSWAKPPTRLSTTYISPLCNAQTFDTILSHHHLSISFVDFISWLFHLSLVHISSSFSSILIRMHVIRRYSLSIDYVFMSMHPMSIMKIMIPIFCWKFRIKNKEFWLKIEG